jgi:cyclomaltodextrinase / maltogenic alpha-amylase / neopullulanase
MLKKVSFSLLFVVAAFLFTSCNEQNNTSKIAATGDYIQGLASPIRLKYDSTTVNMTDYFANSKDIEKIEWNGQQWKTDTSGMLLLTGKASAPVSNLKVLFHGVAHDIPVFASEKVKHTFTYKATSDKVTVVELSGSMNGWNRKATPLRKLGETYTTELVLNNGLYQYRIWEDGKEMLDAGNPEKISNGMGGFNSTFYAGEKKSVPPRMLSISTSDRIIELKDLDEAKEILAYFNNKLVTSNKIESKITITLPTDAKEGNVRVFAHNGVQRYNDIFIPVVAGKAVTDAESLSRKNLHTQVMYFAMVDRFVNGDNTNDRPTADPEILPIANNLGGDIAGITQKINDGYFEQLGINTIWISPVSRNAEGAWGLWDKGIRSRFSGYHGYWPLALKEIDDRFGTAQQFKELINVAHAKNMNVILDYVAHHVHESHPLVKAKPEWTTPLYLPDGTMNTEKWDEHRLTTWFDTFLPTWNFADHEVVEALTDTAMYWVENYELDGFRHDATKHINEDFWRTLTKKVKRYTNTHPERQLYQVGETYGSPELISSYISSGQMDAQFDFNLYDAAVDAFAKDQTDFKNLQRVLEESMLYYGSHHLMGNITGNQDRARFISYADGSVEFSEDAKLAGWTRKIDNKSDAGFTKLAMLNTFLMTTPGIPCIYYGDEIGMPGGNDPDNRRMMFFNDWNASQTKLHDITSKLIKLRRSEMALTYGDLFVLRNDASSMIYVRSYMGKNVLVVLYKPNSTFENYQIPAEFAIVQPRSLLGSGIQLVDSTISSSPETKEWMMEVFY